MGLRSLYPPFVKYVMGKKHQLFVDVTVISFASYLAFKKAFGWSLTAVLMHVFQLGMIDIILYVLLALCIYATLMKIITMIINVFPTTRMVLSEAEDLAHCCIAINNEISEHIQRISGKNPIKPTFVTSHSFERNVLLVVDSMARHIIASLPKIVTKDVFVSVYKVPDFKDFGAPRDSLQYICHYPLKRDLVVSQDIVFSDGAFKQYECVQCVQGTASTRLLLDCVNYYKSSNKRHAKIKTYVGMKLMSGRHLLGFVNIEFYNTSFFNTEDELSAFVEQNLLSFRYLMEYQFLKASFFHAVQPHLT